MTFPSYVRVGVRPVLCAFESNGTHSSGFDYEMLKVLAEKLNFKFDVILAPDLKYGTLDKSGNWTGIMGQLQRNEVDFGLSGVGLSEDRYKAFNFTMPYENLVRTFLTRTAYLPKTSTLTYAFTPSIWITILLSLCLISLVFRKLIYRSHSIPYIFLMLLGSLVNQGVEEGRRTVWRRFILSAWIIFSAFVTMIYSSVLLSFLTSPIKMRGVSNFEELAVEVKAGRYSVLAPFGALTADYLLTSESEDLKALGQYIKENNAYYDLNKEIVPEERTAILASRIFFEFTFAESQEYTISEDDFGTFPVAIPTRKGFCCSRKLNALVHRIISAGLYNKWSKEAIFKRNFKKQIKLETPDDVTPLSLEVFQGAFIILFLGWGLGFFVLLLEIYCKKFNLAIFV